MCVAARAVVTAKALKATGKRSTVTIGPQTQVDMEDAFALGLDEVREFANELAEKFAIGE